MSFETALVAWLKTRSALAPIQAGGAWRLTPNRIPQGSALPAIAYTIVAAPSGAAQRLADGISGLTRSWVQLTIWAGSYGDVQSLGATLDAPASAGGLVGFRGVVADRFFDITFITDARDSNDPDSASQLRFIDLVVWHSAAPA